MVNHENKFITGLSVSANAGALESFLLSAPTVDAPFYLIYDAGNENGHYEEVYVTSKSGNQMIHGALEYQHSTDETVVMSFSVEEYAAIQVAIVAAQASISTSVGEMLLYPALTPPTGFLVCDGSAISRTTYSALFSVIGTSFGVGDGSTTFNIPNMKGRVAIGYKSTDTDFDTIGETGGSNTANLQHSHTTTGHTHSISGTTSASGGTLYVDNGSNATFQSRSDHTHTFSGASGTQSDTGTSSALSATQSVLNPYITLQFIIRY